MRGLQPVRQLVVGQQRHRPFEQLFLQAPDARLLQRQRQRAAAVQRGAGPAQRADVLGQRPVHQHRGLAFGAQAIQHAQRTRHLAGEDGFTELEDVVARHVQHRRLDLLEAQFAGCVEQAQLLQLLVRGQQVAFHAVGKEGQRVLPGFTTLHPLALARQALRQPDRQRLALDGLHAHRQAGAVQRAEPGPLHLLAVQARQLHQRQHVVVQAVAVALQRLRPVLAWLARGDADLDQLPLGEQAHLLRRTQHGAPVEVRAADGEDLAFGITLVPGGCADRIAGFLRLQRFVAEHGVQRPQPTLQVGRQLVGANLHRPLRAGSRPADAAPGPRCRSASRGTARSLRAAWPARCFRCSSCHATATARPAA